MNAENIVLQPIGYVRTGVPDAEVPHRRRELVSDIVVLDRYAEALTGIEDWSHLFVLFWMHRLERHAGSLRAHPRGREDLPLLGVLAARGRRRPNPIGLAVVELLKRTGHVLTIRHLDAFNGTPILDLKPYDPYDVVPEPRVPAWWRQMQQSPGR